MSQHNIVKYKYKHRDTDTEALTKFSLNRKSEYMAVCTKMGEYMCICMCIYIRIHEYRYLSNFDTCNLGKTWLLDLIHYNLASGS